MNYAAISKFKMSMGTTSALPSDFSYDLWCEDKPISLMIDLSDLEKSIILLEERLALLEAVLKESQLNIYLKFGVLISKLPKGLYM